MKAHRVAFAFEAARLGTALPELARPDFHDDFHQWQDVFAIARGWNALAPLAARLEECQWKAELPERVRMELEKLTAAERLGQSVFEGELQHALSPLLHARIPVMLARDTVMRQRYAGNPLLRSAGEVDLLVPMDQFTSALRALGKAGYRVTGDSDSRRPMRALSRKPGISVGLRVHQFLLRGNSRREMAVLWDRSEEAKVPDHPRALRTLSASDELQGWMIQGIRRQLFHSPVWLSDLDRIIRTPSFQDWDSVIWGLAEQGALNGAWLCLNLLRHKWATPIPPEVVRDLNRQAGKLRVMQLKTLSKPESWHQPSEQGLTWRLRTRFLFREEAPFHDL